MPDQLQEIFRLAVRADGLEQGVPFRTPDNRQLLALAGINEFVAYSQLGPLKSSLIPFFTIATFALCGLPTHSLGYRSAVSARCAH